MRRIISRTDVEELEKVRNAARAGVGTGDVVRNFGEQAGASNADTENYTSRLLKLIPADVVAVFITIDGVIRSAHGSVAPITYWILFVILTVATYFYVMRIAAHPLLPKPYLQAVFSATSFVVWVFAIGGPFSYSQVSWYHPVYGALLLPVYTLLAPLVFSANPSPPPQDHR